MSKHLSYRCQRLLALGVLFVLSGCASQPVPESEPAPLAADYAAAVAAFEAEVAAGTANVESAAALRRAFLEAPGFSERNTELLRLHQEIALNGDENGEFTEAVAREMLAAWPGDLLGHYLLKRLERDRNDEAASAHHQMMLELFVEAFEATGSGEVDTPFRAIYRDELQLYLLVGGATIKGAQFQATRDFLRFGIHFGPMRDGHWRQSVADLTEVVQAMARDAGEGAQVSPFSVVMEMARYGDAAAQYTVATWFLANQGGDSDAAAFDKALEWLELSAQNGNLLAQTRLAELTYAGTTRDDDPEARTAGRQRAYEMFIDAAAGGSLDAMVSMAFMHLRGVLGEADPERALSLLEEAAVLGSSRAYVVLGDLYERGQTVERDTERAAEYYFRAADSGSAAGKYQYVRLWVQANPDARMPDEVRVWLSDAVAGGVPGSHYLKAYLYRDGRNVIRDYPVALEHYRQSLTPASTAQLVNQVAWLLATAVPDGLRDGQFAVEAMERMMTTDDAAAEKPEYIDTWAAAWAEVGEFDRAIELQQRALERAREIGQELDIYEKHLELFRQGQPVRE